jgi:hypothetical protein
MVPRLYLIDLFWRFSITTCEASQLCPSYPQRLGIDTLTQCLISLLTPGDCLYTEAKPSQTEGRITWKETIVDGVENAPKAFIGLFKGENFGKMLVRIGLDSSV